MNPNDQQDDKGTRAFVILFLVLIAVVFGVSVFAAYVNP